MCDPIALSATGLAIGAGSAVTNYIGQAQSGIAQAEFQNEMYSKTGQMALDNYIQQMGTSGVRLQQEEAASGQTAMQNKIASMQSLGTAAAAAAGAGVEGNSVLQLFDEFSRQESGNNLALSMNLNDKRDQLQREELAMQAGGASRIASATPSPVAMPSNLGLAFQLGASGLNSYDKYSRLEGVGPYRNVPHYNIRG